MGTVHGESVCKLTSPSAETTKDKLHSVDWDFADRTTHSEIEGLHPYPAKFIAELPRALLEVLSVPTGTAVLDPYCGSGTSLVESQRIGVPSIGIDLNPIACLISRVKTSPLADGVFEAIWSVMQHARRLKDPEVPSIPNLDHWFSTPAQHGLAALTHAFRSLHEAHRDIFRLALSSIIVRVSNQESDTRYAAIAKTVSIEDVFIAFERALHRIFSTLSTRPPTTVPTTVIEADTLTIGAEVLERPIGAVITSPPYPNAYEYWLYHKYRMWWLGFDPIAVKEREIGARAHFFKQNRHTAEDFGRQMAATFRLLQHCVVRGGYVCVVVGRSKIHGVIVDNAITIEETGAAHGFHLEFRAERVLSPNRKSFNLSHANIKTETVLVLRHQ